MWGNPLHRIIHRQKKCQERFFLRKRCVWVTQMRLIDSLTISREKMDPSSGSRNRAVLYYRRQISSLLGNWLPAFLHRSIASIYFYYLLFYWSRQRRAAIIRIGVNSLQTHQVYLWSEMVRRWRRFLLRRKRLRRCLRCRSSNDKTLLPVSVTWYSRVMPLWRSAIWFPQTSLVHALTCSPVRCKIVHHASSASDPSPKITECLWDF